MNFIQKLTDESNSVESLSLFLKNNINDIFNFIINQKHSKLAAFKAEIDNYISTYFNKSIKKLDLTLNENEMFIDLLIDISERLNFSLYFRRLCRLKEKANLGISTRNKAAQLYLKGNRSFQDFENIFENILEKLQFSFEFEEDNDKRVVAIFYNFYSNLILDFGENNLQKLIPFFEKLKQNRSKYSFLKGEISDKIFSIDITADFLDSYNSIHLILDEYLEREDIILTFNKATYLIEIDSKYANQLKETDKDFYSIRDLATRSYNPSDDIFYSLGRGVSILTEEQQLFAYMYSFGKMHFGKCKRAFNKLSKDFFEKPIEIIDWGCGQALASMSYLDISSKKGVDQVINKIILNEPSELALKRAALHIINFNNEVDLITINKDINSLVASDFVNCDSTIDKLHLFSNILDIDGYSTNHLSDLIKSCFKGLNHFVIISPYITSLKTNRIDNFISKFKALPGFELIEAENKEKQEWENNWSLVLRIFKVAL